MNIQFPVIIQNEIVLEELIMWLLQIESKYLKAMKCHTESLYHFLLM